MEDLVTLTVCGRRRGRSTLVLLAAHQQSCLYAAMGVRVLVEYRSELQRLL